MWSTVLGACTLFGAATLTAWCMNVALSEWLARPEHRPLPRQGEWQAMCRCAQHRMVVPALLSVVAALAVSTYLDDDRWQVGAALMIGAICYTWDAIVPAGAVLRSIDPSRQGSVHLTRARFRGFALQHYPLIGLGLSALVSFVWAYAG